MFIENPEMSAASYEVPEGFRLAPEGKSAHVHAILQPTTKKYLQQMAKKRGLSVNELINRALKAYINQAAR